METNYEEVKDSLLSFGKKHLACQYEYKRLYAAESVEAVMAVVKDNFSWCCQFYDFADVLLAYRDQFAEHKIWINTSVEIKEGVGYLLTTEGEFNAESRGTSTINARSWGTSTINARSRETSTINAESRGTSTINARSWETSTINARSRETSTINAESRGTSTINAESWETSTINAESWETSTINARSWETSTINAESWGTSTINAESRETSTINARSWETSTMIIPTSAIECQVNDKSIARYIQDNRVVFADDSIKFEKQG